VSGTITAIILGVFAFTTLILVQLRQLMREITRTTEEWRKLKKVFRREDPEVDSRAGERSDKGPMDHASSRRDDRAD
jgi:hypothetical protein